MMSEYKRERGVCEIWNFVSNKNHFILEDGREEGSTTPKSSYFKHRCLLYRLVSKKDFLKTKTF